MSNALVLTPQDENYLTSRLVFQQLSENYQIPVATNDDVTIDSGAKVLLNGSGMVQLSGFITVDSTPVANMELCELPPEISPAVEGIFPVSVDRAGAYVANGVQVTASGGADVESVTVVNPGSYSAVPTLVTTGPGVGATFASHMHALTVTDVAAGSGYAPANTITLTGGTSSAAVQLTVATTKLVSAAVNAGGSGYVVGDRITLAGGAGATPAVLEVATLSGSAVATFTIFNAGSYTTNSATFTQASTTGVGTGATFNTALFGVNTKTVTNAGNYTALPSNPVAQGSTSGSGTGYTCNITWSVLSVAVTAAGEGYTSESNILFNSGAATARLVLGEPQNSKVILLNSPTAADKVYLDAVIFLTKNYN